MGMEERGGNRRVKRAKNAALNFERNRARKFRSTANFVPQNQPKKFGKSGKFPEPFLPCTPRRVDLKRKRPPPLAAFSPRLTEILKTTPLIYYSTPDLSPLSSLL